MVRQEIARLIDAGLVGPVDRRAGRRGPRGRPPARPGGLARQAGLQRIARQCAQVHSLISGASALLAGPDSERGGTIAEILISVPAISIAGGTDEIQHTIIGERIMGLPKEPDISRNIPFRDVRNG